MMLKGVSVTIFVSIILDSCLGNVLPSGCKKPAFAENFDVAKIEGLWYIRKTFNSGGRLDKPCKRNQYVTRTDKHSFFKTMLYFEPKTGDLDVTQYEITQPTTDSFVLQLLNDKSIKIYAYAARHGDNMFIQSLCFTKNGEFDYQGYVILTKEKDGNEDAIDDVVKKSDIKVTDSYDVPQDDNCFKYKASN